MIAYGMVICNRYPELAKSFIKSVRRTHRKMPPILVVRDRNDAQYRGVTVLDGELPFVFARNANIGINHFNQSDVMLCNDDLLCQKEDFFHELYAIFRKYPRCGMMSPLIKGGVANDVQNYYKMGKGKNEVISKVTLCFPCVVINREVIDKIGLLDENFVGYGGEDIDYSLRVNRAGYDVMVTRQLYITHGNGKRGLHNGKNYSLSFAKEPRTDVSKVYFREKYGRDA